MASRLARLGPWRSARSGALQRIPRRLESRRYMSGMDATRRLTVRDAEALLIRRVRKLLLIATRPLGYLAFVAALAALSTSAKLLGDEHELGFFAGCLNETIRRYPEVTRRGVQMAWLSWFL